MNVKSVLSWVGSLLLLLLGVVFLFGAPPVGVVLVLVGLYFLPAVQFDFQIAEALFWLGGVVLILLGLLFVSSTVIGGVLGILSGLLALPPARDRLTSRFEIRFERAVMATVVLLVAGASFGAIYLQESQSEPPTIKQHDTGEQFTVEGTASTVGFTVEKVRTVPTLQPGEEDGSPGETNLLVVVRMENRGEEPVTVWKDDLAVVTEDDEVYQSASEVSSDIPSDGEYTGLSVGEVSPRIEPGGEIRRTYVFETTESGTYLFTVSTAEQFSPAANHYVPIGRVEIETE
ncbi:hypothetical protein [Haloarcula halophila]|uniref:hypothetical protein n=1 Tax=Haloarcula TaxID=2237 RepID=UPI0023E364BA|nr:hypothetical protein [Halomicroarcula sp. DFY41]